MAGERGEGLVGSSKSGRVGHSSIERSNHHGEVGLVAGVEEEVVASKHHGNVEQNHGCGEQVERDAALAEALEEARSHLQTDAEDKEDEPEVLYEREDACGGCEADVSGKDARKEHECDSQRDAANLDFPQQYAY